MKAIWDNYVYNFSFGWCHRLSVIPADRCTSLFEQNSWQYHLAKIFPDDCQMTFYQNTMMIITHITLLSWILSGYVNLTCMLSRLIFLRWWHHLQVKSCTCRFYQCQKQWHLVDFGGWCCIIRRQFEWVRSFEMNMSAEIYFAFT